MNPLDALVPVLSTFVGAAITYGVNVRSRRRTYVEDLFNQAIAAVAAAESSIDYLSSAGRPLHLTDEEYEQLQKWFVTEGLKNWAKKVTEALARVTPYQPELAGFLPYQPDAGNRRRDDIVAVLKRGRGMMPLA